MFRSKKDVDAHVRDVFSKCDTESDRLKLCFAIAKQYAGIKEFDSARRYLDAYFTSNPVNVAEAHKLMGDIQLELGESERALESYKAAYTLGKGRDSLNRVCDLFARGFGSSDSAETKKYWMDLQKSSPGSSNSSFTTSSNSPAMPKKTPIPTVGPPKTGFSHTSFTNGVSSHLVSSTSKTNGGNVDLQLRYLERRFDDGLGKILDQNTMALEQMLRLKDDMRDLSEKMEHITSTQQRMQEDIKEIQDKEKGFDLSAQLNKLQMTNVSSGTSNKCPQCEDLSREVRAAIATLTANSKSEYSSLKEHIESLQKLTIKSVENYKELASKIILPLQTKKDESSKVSTNPAPPPSHTNASSGKVDVPLSQLFKKPEGSWNCEACYLSNVKDATLCSACQTSRPGFENAVKKETTLPAVQPNFSFGFPATNPITPPTLNFGIKAVSTPVDAPDATNATPVKPDENKDSPFAGLNLSGKLGFADIAAKNNNSNFTFGSASGTTPSFTGTGTPVFYSFNTTNKNDGSNNSPIRSSTAANTSGNAEEVDDFVPTAEFQPVIPLPPLVEVKKGDEDENTIAEYRAKLYRFVAESKEWKERGVGNIKLLQAKDGSGKCRVVMWREKVGKLACNFNLFPDIKVTNYQNNPKVLCWKCQDFAEEPAWETFTLRFANEDNCAHFKREMERLASLTTAGTSPKKDESSTATSNPITSQTNGAVGTSDVPLSQLFKKPEGSWNCEACYVSNSKDVTSCSACQTPRPGFENAAKKETTLPAVQPTFSFGFPSANSNPLPSINFGINNISTPVADAPDGINSTPVKSDETKDSPFVGLNLSGKLSFADFAAKNNNSNFTFGSASGTTPSFTGTGAPLFSSSSNNANTSANADEGEDEFVPTAEFQPVIPLPPLVEVKKGDENENTIVEYRAKLYRFVAESKEWKERGIGNLKLLEAKDGSGKSRVVMWREKVGKLACNFNLFPDIKVTNFQNDQKKLTWKCQDFAEEPAWETFAVKFSNEDNCAHFKREMERLASLAVTGTSPKKDETSNPTATQTNGSGDKSGVPLSQLFKKPEGSWNCEICYLSNLKDVTSCSACQTPRPGFENAAKNETTLPAVQPTFSFGFPGTNAITPPSLKFGMNTASTPASLTEGSNATPVKSDETKDSPFVGLNLSGKLSFADFAAKNNNSNFTFGNTSGTTPSFAGSGTPLFSASNNANTSANKSANADEVDDFVPTAEFQPVIPLPPLVEVKKGDENENTIVEYRAKLYRFAAETKEWKERGIGNIKLLQAKDGSGKCRVVMWREKIGKLACNFNLYPDIKVTNFQNDQKKLTWKCQDFAEEPAWETFAVKFSNEDNCSDFKKKVMEYASGTVMPENVSSTQEEVTSCPGCIGCNADDFKFPDHKGNHEEATIDIPLGDDTSVVSPFVVSLSLFEDNKSPLADKTSVDKVNNSNQDLSSFSFSLQTPEKNSTNTTPGSFQLKTPNFSFKPSESGSPSIFGGASIFSPSTGANAAATPSPFVSPFAQNSFGGINNSASPQQQLPPASTFSFAQAFQQNMNQVGGNDDDEERQEEDEYEDVDDEDECMFEEDAHIFMQDSDSDDAFVDKGEGVVRVLYDGESYCARLVILVDAEIIAEHLVAVETHLEAVDDKTYQWTGVCNYEAPNKSKIKVTFSTDETCQNFTTVMADGLEFAEQAGITEAVLMEDTSGY